MTYQSMPNDGTAIRLPYTEMCEWCGGLIPTGNLSAMRSYRLDGVWVVINQHLTCIELCYDYCLEHGHTFTRFNMQPIAALRGKV